MSSVPFDQLNWVFVATASIDGSHFVIAWVSEYVTPQQEAQVSHQIPQEAPKFFKLAVQQF